MSEDLMIKDFPLGRNRDLHDRAGIALRMPQWMIVQRLGWLHRRRPCEDPSRSGSLVNQQTLWKESRRILERAATQLRSEEGRLLAASVQWWEIPGFPERWPVVVLGAGPPLLIVQGFDASFLDFQLLVIQLAQSHRVLVPDLCGFGFCPRSRHVEVSLDGIVRHLEALIDSAAFAEALAADGASAATRAFGLIGASMGTQVALDLARRRPERVNRLMLLSPSGLMEPVFHLPFPPVVDVVMVWLLGIWLTRYLLHRWMHARPSHSFGPKEKEAMMAHLRVSGWGWGLRQFFRSEGVGEFDGTFPDKPILAVMGGEDPLLSRKQKDLLRKALGERIRVIPGSGHALQWEQPELVAQLWGESGWPQGNAS